MSAATDLSLASVPGPTWCTPHAPTTIRETGLSRELIIDLVLKVLHVQGARTGMQITETIRLPFELIDDLLLNLQRWRFLEVRATNGPARGGNVFDLTSAGRARALEAYSASQYVGPAPVPLDVYRAAIQAQSVRSVQVGRERLRQGLSDLQLAEETLASLGPAVNSGSSLFLYGAPGNGKTAIAERITRMVEGALDIPYAVEVGGHIVVIFDAAYHHPLQGEVSAESGPPWLQTVPGFDQRFVRVLRPCLVTGGELTLEQLDLQYDRDTKIYQAPFQLKAAGGVLIIDDFGRQRVEPHELLNRWIFPLEKGIDFLTLHTGQKLMVPFDSLLIFATNLDPVELVDEAFLRRIHYKIEVNGPTPAIYERIFAHECERRGLRHDPAAVAFIYRKYYHGCDIPPRACHPRDILDHLGDLARYQERPASLEADLLDAACLACFVVQAADRMKASGGRPHGHD